MQTRLTQLVPSKGRRYDLKEFAYTLLTRGESVENVILMMKREKRVDSLIATEITAWVIARSFPIDREVAK
jgi:hypothetical protein